jgi:hypothetical protein
MRCVWATLAVLALAASRVAAVKRQHYVGADQVWWNYAPSGENQCVGAPFDERTGLYTLAGLGSRYLKAVYQEYTDGTFQVRAGWRLLGHPPSRQDWKAGKWSFTSASAKADWPPGRLQTLKTRTADETHLGIIGAPGALAVARHGAPVARRGAPLGQAGHCTGGGASAAE